MQAWIQVKIAFTENKICIDSQNDKDWFIKKDNKFFWWMNFIYKGRNSEMNLRIKWIIRFYVNLFEILSG